MIWIRIFVMLFATMLAIYYAMLILQCFTPWFRFTNRDITFGRCLVPFYYWIASTDEKVEEKDDEDEEIDEEDEELNEEIKARKEEFNKNFKNKIK